MTCDKKYYREGEGLNIDSGHCKPNSSNQLLAVQTPATNFTVNPINVGVYTKCCLHVLYCIQVTAYPGEILHVDVSPYDEQNYLTSENFQIVEDTYDHNVCIKLFAVAVCNY